MGLVPQHERFGHRSTSSKFVHFFQREVIHRAWLLREITNIGHECAEVKIIQIVNVQAAQTTLRKRKMRVGHWHACIPSLKCSGLCSPPRMPSELPDTARL